MAKYELVPDEQAPAPPEKSFSEKAANIAKAGLRHGARTLTNLAGLATGLPGEIAKLANRYIPENLKGAIGGPALKYAAENLQGSQAATESYRKIAPEYLKPHNKVEEFADDVINDTALLLSPAKTKVPYAKTAITAGKYLKPFFISLGSNVLGKSIEDLSGDTSLGTKVKTGAMFALSLLNKPAASKYASGLYNEAESAIPAGAKLDARTIETNTNSLKNSVLSSRPHAALAESEKFIVDEADHILNMIRNGEMDVATAWAAKRSLNEKLEKVLYATPKKEAQARARKLAKGINKDLSNALNKYGQTNTQFGQPFKNAEDAFSTIAKSNVISKFAENHLKYSPVTAGLIHLFHGPIGVAGAQLALPYQAAKITYRIAKSPTLTKYYGNVLNAAASENAVIFNRELQKLDNALQKEKSKDRFELIED